MHDKKADPGDELAAQMQQMKVQHSGTVAPMKIEVKDYLGLKAQPKIMTLFGSGRFHIL